MNIRYPIYEGVYRILTHYHLLHLLKRIGNFCLTSGINHNYTFQQDYSCLT